MKMHSFLISSQLQTAQEHCQSHSVKHWKIVDFKRTKSLIKFVVWYKTCMNLNAILLRTARATLLNAEKLLIVNEPRA